MTALVQRRPLVLMGAAAAGIACGAIVVRSPTGAALIGCIILALLGLVTLAERAYAWALVVLVVAPWYPLLNDMAGPPVVPERIFCLAIAAAPLVPWLWSLGGGRIRTRPNPAALMYALLFLCLTVVMYEGLGGLKPMIASAPFGYLFTGVAFLCARRFHGTSGWPAAAFAGCVFLIVLGLASYVSAPGQRIGFSTGYPITYGALLVGLLPSALVFAARRSVAVAVAVGLLGTLAIILSQSRSSWIAAITMLAVVVTLLKHHRQTRALAWVAAATVVTFGAVWFTGSLHHLIEAKISSNVATTDSVTHRTWSYGYALRQIRHRPFIGAGQPGYAAQQAGNETDIGALDEGYLTTLVDLGLFGLLAMLIPIGVAIVRIAQWLRTAAPPPAEDVGLALGIIGIAVVTVFYDSFSWAQIAVLLGAMAGTLSVRSVARERRPRRRPRRRIRVILR